MIQGKIELKGMEFHARHGCLETERLCGGRFRVDVSFNTDMEKAAIDDCIDGTVDYSQVHALVACEMAKESKLLENLAWRIKCAIEKKFPQISGLSVKVTKFNPPLKGIVKESSVTI